MMQNKFIFGITGGSGSGKSEASNILRTLGAEIIDCDKVSRCVTEKNSPCLAELEEEFGENIIDKKGELRRHILGQIVFSDKKKLEKLNTITHKYIYSYIIEKLDDSDKDIIGIDGALLIGGPFEQLCKIIIGVVADDNIRCARIMNRDSIDEHQAVDRINSQKSNNFYIENSDYLIYNNSTRENLEKSVKEVWKQLKERKKEDQAVF